MHITLVDVVSFIIAYWIVDTIASRLRRWWNSRGLEPIEGCECGCNKKEESK